MEVRLRCRCFWDVGTPEQPMTVPLPRSGSRPPLLVVSADTALVVRLGGRLLAAGYSLAWEPSPARAALRLDADPRQQLLLDVADGRLGDIAPLTAALGRSTVVLVDGRDKEAREAVPGWRRLDRRAPVEAVLERLESLEPAHEGAAQPRADSLRVGPLVLEASQRTALAEQTPIALSWSEFDLLWLLASRAREVVAREELHRRIIGTEFNPESRAIDIRISRLRQKLVAAGLGPSLLKAVRFSGYVLIPPV